MNARRFKIVGLGELLWDFLPAGRQLGGAPANFAYITALLGDEGIAASGVGNDDLGTEAIRRLAHLGVATSFIQSGNHPTGRVNVELDSSGQPRFEVCSPVAWDFLEWTPQWKELAHDVDAVCFGSLAQRSKTSRSTICNFVDATRSDAVRIFDVNLRQHFYTEAVLLESMQRASIVKLNHEELPTLMQIFGLRYQDQESAARQLASRHNLKLLCVTRGSSGSALLANDECNQHSGFQVEVADTVGAGDAFTAALVHEYVRGASLKRMNAVANRVGAWVASQVGAMPVPQPSVIDEILSALP